MKIAIVENETAEAENIKRIVQSFEKENTIPCSVDIFQNGADFLTDYSGYDAVFLDIQMPIMDGMETAHRLRTMDKDIQIIFTTNMAQYALEGYRVQALDFLVKPVSEFDIEIELKKIANMQRSEDTFFWITTGGNIQKIFHSEIRYIETYRHTLYFHIDNEVVSLRGTIKEYENKLDKKVFSRPNCCYLVNMSYIRAIKNDDIILDEGQILHISRPRKKEFLDQLSNYINRSVLNS